MSTWVLAWHWMLHASVQDFLGLAMIDGSFWFLWLTYKITRMIDDQ